MNFSTAGLLAIVSRTGRDISGFSAHPAEQEIVLPPEVVLLEVPRSRLPDGRPVIIVEQLAEPGAADALPPTLDALVSLVDDLVERALKGPDVSISTPGEICGAAVLPQSGLTILPVHGAPWRKGGVDQAGRQGGRGRPVRRPTASPQASVAGR
ncbi:hypothetical protein HR12_12725 [Microbacterium sp. SUBG005]|nr:hypothetical protein HR12_12725 [Microbacterium sp. SUBG005]